MRVTEQSHDLTEGIDEASVTEMIHQIGQADQQMFGSTAWGAGLLDPILLRNLKELQASIRDVLDHPAGRLIIAGAGTSGRIAMQAAATCTLNGSERVDGILAGGPEAFFKARERVEDQPSLGARDLKAALKTGGPFVYIGITCGLTAPYIAGQVQTALIANAESTIVIGFNRIHHADKRIHPGLVRSFLDILEDLNRTRNGALLNPIIGPEPITGSTRMKGGNATRIMLDCLLNPVDPEMMIKCYRSFHSKFYEHAEMLAPLITKAGQALLAGGSLIYIAAPREGLLTLIDASECPPTFGSTPSQVRAFVDGHFEQYLPEFNLTGLRLSDFHPGPLDLVVALGSSAELETCISQNQERGIEIHQLNLPETLFDLPEELRFVQQNYQDLAYKWALNLISTCAFIQYGKIFGNQMIDLRISNLKLWERACRIVAEIGRIETRMAEQILRTIVAGAQDPGDLILNDVISRAVTMERVVARAVLIARGKSPDLAEKLARLTPKLKDCLRDLS